MIQGPDIEDADMKCDCGAESDTMVVFNLRHEMERRICPQCSPAGVNVHTWEFRHILHEDGCPDELLSVMAVNHGVSWSRITERSLMDREIARRKDGPGFFARLFGKKSNA